MKEYFSLKKANISKRQTLSGPPETATKIRDPSCQSVCVAERVWTRFKNRRASKGSERGMLDDNVFDGFDRLVEFALFVFDDVVIEIGVFEPFF